MKETEFFICVSSVFISGDMLIRFQNVFDAADGDDDPVGTVVEFVTDLINSFVEEIGFEKNLEVVRILRDEYRAGRGPQITLEKSAAHLAIPDVGPVFEERNVFGAHGLLP